MWGEKHGYFDTPEDAQVFYDELVYMMVHQMCAPNSPQWFNTGLNFAYGISGPAQGHWVVNPKTGQAEPAPDAYTHHIAVGVELGLGLCRWGRRPACHAQPLGRRDARPTIAVLILRYPRLAEVLGHHDVRRELRPGLGHLGVAIAHCLLPIAQVSAGHSRT